MEDLFTGRMCIGREQSDTLREEGGDEPEAYLSDIFLRLYCHNEEAEEAEIGTAKLTQVHVYNAVEDGMECSWPFESDDSLEEFYKLIEAKGGNGRRWHNKGLHTEIYPYSMLLLDTYKLEREFPGERIFKLFKKWVTQHFDALAPLLVVELNDGLHLTEPFLREMGFKQIQYSSFYWIDLSGNPQTSRNVIPLTRPK